MVYWTIDKTALAMYIYVFKHYIFAKITWIDFHLKFYCTYPLFLL